jgi:hypothetical protein
MDSHCLTSHRHNDRDEFQLSLKLSGCGFFRANPKPSDGAGRHGGNRQRKNKTSRRVQETLNDFIDHASRLPVFKRQARCAVAVEAP